MEGEINFLIAKFFNEKKEEKIFEKNKREKKLNLMFSKWFSKRCLRGKQKMTQQMKEGRINFFPSKYCRAQEEREFFNKFARIFLKKKKKVTRL